MSRFEIKKDVKLHNDNDYIWVNEAPSMFRKKIPSRSFAALLGLDEWNSIGKQLLELLNLLEKDSEPFNTYYTLRGDVAETYVSQLLEEQFKRQFPDKDIEIILFNEKNFPYMDQFNYDRKTGKGNKVFSGRMDVAIKVREKNGKLFKAYIVEVKSKSHTTYEDVILIDEKGREFTQKQFKKSDYELIAVEKKYPKTELYQGIFLATLGTLDKIDMIWVFFTDEQEKEMQKYVDWYMKQDVPRKLPKLSFTYKDLTYHTYGHQFSRYEMKEKMTEVYKLLNSCFELKRIPHSLFNKCDLETINRHIKDQRSDEEKTQKFKDRTDVSVGDLFGESENDDDDNDEERKELYNL